MDACAWGVTQDEAVVVMNGIWNGFSSGTLNMGSNLVGNSRPDMTPGLGSGKPAIGGNPDDGQNPTPNPTPPTPPSLPPSIDNDVVGESFAFVVDVDLWLDSSIFTYFEDGISAPNPTDLSGLVELAIVPYCTGFVVATGGLLSTDGTGSIPVEYAGTIAVSYTHLTLPTNSRV